MFMGIFFLCEPLPSYPTLPHTHPASQRQQWRRGGEGGRVCNYVRPPEQDVISVLKTCSYTTYLHGAVPEDLSLSRYKPRKTVQI